MKKKNTIFYGFLSFFLISCSKWKDPDIHTHPKPRYCYKSLGKITCYETPQKCLEETISGHRGNPPPKKIAY